MSLDKSSGCSVSNNKEGFINTDSRDLDECQCISRMIQACTVCFISMCLKWIRWTSTFFCKWSYRIWLGCHFEVWSDVRIIFFYNVLVGNKKWRVFFFFAKKYDAQNSSYNLRSNYVISWIIIRDVLRVCKQVLKI